MEEVYKAHNSKRDSRTMVREERKLEAAKLRREGWNLADIASELNVCTATVRKYLDEVLASIAEETVEVATTVKEKELARLERVWAQMIEAVEAGGKASVPAAGVCVRISERRSRLLGLDEPTRTENTIKIDDARRMAMEMLLRWVSSLDLNDAQRSRLAEMIDEEERKVIEYTVDAVKTT